MIPWLGHMVKEDVVVNKIGKAGPSGEKPAHQMLAGPIRAV